MRTAFVNTLLAEAELDDRIMLLTGDLGFMALEPFRDRYPKRFYNVGVAEQNMIGVATGLAEAGYVPFCYSIVPFAVLRPYEFIRNGPVIHDLPVRIVGMGSGFDYGTAGPTHFGVEDVGAMRLFRNMAIVAPADSDQTVSAIRELGSWRGPAYVRLSKSERPPVPGLDGRFELGHAQQIRQGSDVVMFTMGNVAHLAIESADRLELEGVSVSIVVLASISPRPVDDVLALISGHRTAVTIEDHVLSGGIGSLIAEVVADHGVSCRLIRIGIEDPFGGRSGGENFLREIHGLTSEAIVARVRSVTTPELFR